MTLPNLKAQKNSVPLKKVVQLYVYKQKAFFFFTDCMLVNEGHFHFPYR